MEAVLVLGVDLPLRSVLRRCEGGEVADGEVDRFRKMRWWRDER